MDEPLAVRSVGPPDESRPDVRSSEAAEFPRRDADAADSDEHSAADDDYANAAAVEAEVVGVRSPVPTCRKRPYSPR